MQWIKYQVLQCKVDEEDIFINKKIGYSAANLVIAKAEAYKGEYEITEDDISFENKPLAVEFGGTGASTPAAARQKLGVVSTDDFEQVSDHIKSKLNPHGVTKKQIGLGNVDNTSDINKPVSNATKAELNLKVDKANAKMKLYTSMTDLGLEASATFADTVAAVQNYTTVFLQPNSMTDASWNFPINNGYIQITRRYGKLQASVIAIGSQGGTYIATLDTNGVPTGVWSKVVRQSDLAAYMPVAGGKFTGAVTLSGDPTSNLQPATKQYVDNHTTYELLWSNSSAISTFGNQSIILSSYNRDDYDFFIVCFRYSTSGATTTSLVVMPNGAMHRVFYFGDIVEGTGLPCVYTRAVTFNRNDIVFGEAYYNYTDSASSVVDNTRLIPTHIYGIKLH